MALIFQANSETPFRNFNPGISWSHYIQLMRVGNLEERSFYEIEIVANKWDIKEFQRQFNSHLKNIFKDAELSESSVIRNFRITAADGKSYDTKHYN